MNVYLLQLIEKLISLIVITFISIFNPGVIGSKNVNVDNTNKNKNLTVINKVTPHDTKTTFNSSLPSNITKVKTPGIDGIVYVDNVGNTTSIVQQMVTEEVEVGTGDQSEYVGRLSGYGPDCPGCSKVGNVACYTKKKTKHSLINNGEYYQDDQYGKVRIVAAARSKFPCGTIVKITKAGITPFYAVVLDSGGSMVKAWKENGTVWMDLAYKSQADAKVGGISGTNIQFSVQRWGW